MSIPQSPLEENHHQHDQGIINPKLDNQWNLIPLNIINLLSIRHKGIFIVFTQLQTLRRFISTGQRLFPREDRADELRLHGYNYYILLLDRNKMKQANISCDVISPPQKRSLLQWGTNHSSQQVVDILSAPVIVNNYDVVADDLAEMAATYTFKLSADDTTNSTVASFRPITSS